MEEFLKKLGIKNDFSISDDDCLVIDIKDSDEYAKFYSILDKSEEIEEDADFSQVTMESSTINFNNEQYTISLLADFENDTYRLSMREN